MNRLLTFILLFPLGLWTWADNEERAAEIKADPRYIYGEGRGLTLTEADNNALSDLISQISVTVDATTDLNIDQLTYGDKVELSTSMRSLVQTCANAHLNNTEKLTLSYDPNAHVMRYVLRDEVDKMFKSRLDKAFNYANEASKAEEKCKIGTALRSYYWSLMLVKGLQNPGAAEYTDPTGDKHNMLIYLPQRIQDILSDITANVTNYSDNEATLFFTYNGQPVQELDFTFYNGNSWAPLNSVKNGNAMVDLRPGVDATKLRIQYEYEYKSQNIDPEIESLLAFFKPVLISKAEVAVTDKSNLKDAVSKSALVQQKEAVKLANTCDLDQVEGRKPYEKIMEQIIKGITTQDYASIEPLFTPDGLTTLNQLLNFGKARMLPKQTQTYGFYDLGEGRVVCRSLVMNFDFPRNNRTFTEDVTFTFDADKKIEAVSFGLGSEAQDAIWSHALDDEGHKIWSDASVNAISTFLENYKTAFALKKIDYLEGVFDDNAVIITGTVMKRPQVSSDGNSFGNSEVVHYNHYNKSQYMDKLRKTFKAQDFVNLRFTDNDVSMMGAGGELYSVQIHQDYYSSTYCDTGYLFLIVDLNNPDQPSIKVRTWQPQRDPEINGRVPKSSPDYGLIGPYCF